MTDAMKELYDIFKEESKDKWIKEGRREGIKEGVINTLLMLVKDGIISVEDAAKRANLSVSKFQKYLNVNIVIFKNNEDTVKGVLFNTLKHRKVLIKVIK